jgi:hypothetical protein
MTALKLILTQSYIQCQSLFDLKRPIDLYPCCLERLALQLNYWRLSMASIPLEVHLGVANTI